MSCHNPWAMTQEEVLIWAERGILAANAETELRRAVKAMTSLLLGREWAEHLSADPDAQALEMAITVTFTAPNAVVNGG